jgi:predicted nicotinamide N-methyase
LKRLIAYAERYPKGATPTSIPGGREVADALSLGERMTVLRELRSAIKPEVATWTPNVKDKVLCAGSWLPAGEEPVYEDTTVTVGDRTYAVKQCTQHCLGSGSRLWASAVALSRYLAVPNPPMPPGQMGRLNRAGFVRGKCVVELGSGVGLVARVCCDQGAESVLATDAEERLLDVVRANAPNAQVKRLDWAAPDLSETFDVVLGADLIYSSGAMASGLLETCTSLCRPGGMLLLCVPAGRHGLDELVNAINQDARWGAAAVQRFSAKDVADGHTFLLVGATRSEPVPHPVRADPLALRQSGQLPASSGFCGEPSGLPLPRAPAYVPHSRRPA